MKAAASRCPVCVTGHGADGTVCSPSCHRWLGEALSNEQRQTVRRLAKYSRYSTSTKGRERVERYRNTRKGMKTRFRADINRWSPGLQATADRLGIDKFLDGDAKTQEEIIAAVWASIDTGLSLKTLLGGRA